MHNLSRFAQPAELALAKWAGSTPYEVLGRVPFPSVTEEPYAVTLPPYGFLWFDLVREEGPAGDERRAGTGRCTGWSRRGSVAAGRSTPPPRAPVTIGCAGEVLRAGRPGLLDVVAEVGGSALAPRDRGLSTGR